MADELINQIQNLLGQKVLASQQQPMWAPGGGDPWGAPPQIAEQNLQPGMPFMPPVPPPPSGSAPAGQNLPLPPADGGGTPPPSPQGQQSGLVDQITKIMMHPMTQGMIAALGSGLAARGSAGRKIGAAALGGITGAEAATRTQAYQDQNAAQIEHQKQLEIQKRQEMELTKQNLAQQAQHQTRQEQMQGYQTPEQVAAFKEQISGTEDPELIKAMKIVPQDSPTYARDLQSTYGFLVNSKQKEEQLAVKEQYQNALMEQKRMLEETKIELARNKQEASVQAKMMSIDLGLAKLNAEMTKNAQQLELEKQKMLNTNLRGAEKLINDYSVKDLSLIGKDPATRTQMIDAKRTEIYTALGIPPQAAAPAPGTTPPIPVRSGGPGPNPAAASDKPVRPSLDQIFGAMPGK